MEEVMGEAAFTEVGESLTRSDTLKSSSALTVLGSSQPRSARVGKLTGTTEVLTLTCIPITALVPSTLCTRIEGVPAYPDDSISPTSSTAVCYVRFWNRHSN